NAMIAALLKASVDRGIEFRFGMQTTSFLTDTDGGVVGIVARYTNASTIQIRARAVILATGGLIRHSNALQYRPAPGSHHISMAARHSDGSMISLAASQLRARVGGCLRENFYWAPMSKMKERNGDTVVFPHIVPDRAKPGIIAINDRG